MVRSLRSVRRSLSIPWGPGASLHHPRLVEWIGVPQSAGLVEFSGSQWVDKLSRDQAVTAAIHLQRDVGLMQTNVDVLDQYALSLQKLASKMIDNCLGPCMYPAEEVAAPRYKWKEWVCDIRPWIRYGSIRMTLIALGCIYYICVGVRLVRFFLGCLNVGVCLSSS